MNETMFHVGATDIDVEKIVSDIKETVARKRESGVYSDKRIARAERSSLAYLKKDDNFLDFYIDNMKESVSVDINDFPIYEKRRFLGGFLVLIKKTIWKMLKFYTYRMWSQQNQVNNIFMSALESEHKTNSKKIEELEKRITELEKR